MNCLQFHYSIIGQIKSFNYEEYNYKSGYLNNLDYSICFRKEMGFCSISYSLPNANATQIQNQQGTNQQLINRPEYFDIISNQNQGSATQSNNQAGAGPTDCPTDYLILANTRLCGGKLNGDLISSNSNLNSEVTGKICNLFNFESLNYLSSLIIYLILIFFISITIMFY